MRKLFTLLLTLQVYTILFAQTTQTGTIRGKVTAGTEPIPFAAFGIFGTTIGGTADAEGRFELVMPEPGSYKVVFSAVGYQKLIKEVELKAGQNITLQINLKPTTSQLGEVVVSGTLKETYTSLSPIKVDVLTPVLFRKNPTPSVFEALQLVNGVQPQLNCNVCGTGDIHINGMEGPYTMITIDGMPIVSGLASVYGLNGIPNSLIQRVEVVKGPASTLYGSEAVGGLINIITKAPKDAPKVAADAFGSSQGEFNLDLGFKGKVGKADVLTGINAFTFNNRLDINNDNFTDITLQNRVSVFNKWSLNRPQDRLATLAARYIYEDRFGGDMQWKPEFRGGDSIYGESIYTQRLELIGMYTLPLAKEKVTLQYSFNHHGQNSAYGQTLFKAQQRVAFAQLLWDKKFRERHDLVLGLPFRYTYYDDNTPGTSSLNRQNQPQHTVLPGLFIQDEMKLTEKLNTLAGLRYDYNSKHGSILSPRLSFKYAADASNIWRLSTGNGYRVVNLFTEDHAALSGAREVIIKNKLKPERSVNVNLNYHKFISLNQGFLELDGSLFYTYFRNKIVGDFLTNDEQIIYDNLDGHAVSKGLTANARMDFTFPLKVNIGATLLRVYTAEKSESGQLTKIPQIYAPAFSGTYDISYTFSKTGLSLDYTGRVNGPMPLPVVENDYRPDMSPWFSLQNIQLTKKWRQVWEFYGGLKNILNFKPKNPILRPFDPFDKYTHINNPNNYTFDPTYIYAPIQGIRGFFGLRYTL